MVEMVEMVEAAEIVEIVTDRDVLQARQSGRMRAKKLGFGRADQTRLATAISELARNILRYAGAGTCTIAQEFINESQVRLQVVVEDNGPGIPDLDLAMSDGYSSGSGLGACLPGAKRLVHEFDIESRPGYTRVTIAVTMKITRPK